MKELLVETILFNPTPVSIVENTNKPGLLTVEGIFATAEVKNGNGRYYSRKIWDREINKYKEQVQNKTSTGELDHPESTVINLKNVCHRITDMWWDGDHIMAKTEILPTPSGNILKALIDSGVSVGVSSRGMGSVKQIGETLEVQDDFELLCWDFVSTPSNPGSWMKPIGGTMQNSRLNENLTGMAPINAKVHDIIREILCSNGSCPIW
jgi:hypothetical protein